jgi:opacity protein-like surface antigen
LKKHTLFLLILILSTTTIAAEKSSLIGIGVQSGVGLANVVITPSAGNLDGVVTPKFGAFIGLNISFLTLDIGAYYALKGAATAAITNRFYYIEFPLLLRIKFYRNRTFRPYIFGGASVANLISAFRISNSTGVVTDIKNGTDSIDYGVIFGGGFEIAMNKGLSIIIDGRYNYGLKDIDPDPNTSTVNRVIEIMAGFKFYL